MRAQLARRDFVWKLACFRTNIKRSMAFHILVVEDNPLDVELVSEALLLWRQPPTLHTVPDGLAAIEFLRKAAPYANVPTPNLILLDLNLPKMNGMEFLQQIKVDPNLSIIPVIVLTTSDRESDVRNAYALHANSYMTKPLEIEEFFNKVKAIEDYWVRYICLPRV